MNTIKLMVNNTSLVVDSSNSQIFSHCIKNLHEADRSIFLIPYRVYSIFITMLRSFRA